MSEPVTQRYSRLIKSLALREIRPVDLHSECRGNLPPVGSQVQLSWTQALAEGDPLEPEPAVRIFRPRFEFFAKQGETAIFHQTSVFVVACAVIDASAFGELWAEPEIRSIFMEKQLRRTLWPLFRQHVHDGMSRLGMSPLPLPWLI